jgi:hypothetical protein
MTIFSRRDFLRLSALAAPAALIPVYAGGTIQPKVISIWRNTLANAADFITSLVQRAGNRIIMAG